MEINDVIRLMQAVSEQGLTSFKLEDGDIKLSIKKEKQMVIAAEGDLVQRSLDIPACAGQEMKTPVLENGMDTTKTEILATDRVVSSPLVGTFYNASSPDSAPFVKAGDAVKKGQTLGIIEAMKLMNWTCLMPSSAASTPLRAVPASCSLMHW